MSDKDIREQIGVEAVRVANTITKLASMITDDVIKRTARGQDVAVENMSLVEPRIKVSTWFLKCYCVRVVRFLHFHFMGFAV